MMTISPRTISIISLKINMLYTFLETPIGRLRLRALDQGLMGVDHTNQQEFIADEWAEDSEANHPVLKLAIEELKLYFLGELTEFTTPLAPLSGLGTPFQQSVWTALQTISYGETASYAKIASIIQNPKAVRAVGAQVMQEASTEKNTYSN